MRLADNCIQSFVFCHAPRKGTSERMKAFFYCTYENRRSEKESRYAKLQIIYYSVRAAE